MKAGQDGWRLPLFEASVVSGDELDHGEIHSLLVELQRPGQGHSNADRRGDRQEQRGGERRDDDDLRDARLRRIEATSPGRM